MYDEEQYYVSVLYTTGVRVNSTLAQLYVFGKLLTWSYQ